MPVALTFPPRAMGVEKAAVYIGVSTTTLRGLDIPRRVCGGRYLYDRVDLDAFVESLPYEGDAPKPKAQPRKWPDKWTRKA